MPPDRMGQYCNHALKCNNSNCSLRFSEGNKTEFYIAEKIYKFDWRAWEGCEGKRYECEKDGIKVISEFEFQMIKSLEKEVI